MSFSADISRFIQKTKLRADVVLRKVAMDAFVGVTKRSPVDTGRFRGNWRVAVNRIDPTNNASVSTTPHGVEPSGAELNVALSQIASAVFGDTIHITNNLPYAERLENGWSDQAPQGMLRLTFEELKSNINKLVAEAADG